MASQNCYYATPANNTAQFISQKGGVIAKKKSRGASKSGAVRDYLIENPDATASVVIPELAQRGIDVSPALANQIKTRMKRSGELVGGASAVGETSGKKKSTKKRVRGRGSARKSATGAGTTSKSLTADDLMAVKRLADELGGIEQARTALKYLEELG